MKNKIILSVHGFVHNTFDSLKNRNFRLYFIGQLISVSGTFMQAVAQAWLVLKISHSGVALGLITALQFLPILVFGPWGGVIADRFNKRKLLFVTQFVFGIQALLLGILVLGGSVQLWMVGVLAFAYGIVNTIDNPTRQTFVPEMVGENRLSNAVSLYSSLVNMARVLGPILAGVLIATIGLGLCFILNGISYAAIILLLIMMNTKELHTAKTVSHMKGRLSEGFRYIIATPILRNTLLMMAIIGTLTYEFQVSLPMIAEFTFHGDAGTYAFLTAAQGIGSIAGGIVLAGKKKVASRMLVITALLFGITTVISAVMPTLSLTLLVILFVGFFSIYFLSLGNTILQLESVPEMRGRVMSYWTMAFLGSTAIGGPIIGWIGQQIGPRWGLGVGGFAAIIAAVFGFLTITKMKATSSPEISTAADLAADEDKRVL